ncbi:23617_t:CDS:1, partial [Gigaspora rosea]
DAYVAYTGAIKYDDKKLNNGNYQMISENSQARCNFYDNYQYSGSLYCGAMDCEINIGKQYLYQGTEYERYLDNGTPYSCENCDEIYQGSEEYTG